ncbi:MAG: esterase/lipase family protein [Methylobacter sp.]
MANNHPVVLVHGLFGYGPKEMLGFSYWGQAMKVPCSLQRFEATVGPISSSHDRACELFAQITGTRVDYGKTHSQAAGHEQYDDLKTFPIGFYPEWSEKNPIHLVGHSHGGPTIRMLQYLLHIDHWGIGTNANWIKSITGISPVFNGSTLTYMLGCDEESGKVTTPIGTFLGKSLELFAGITNSLPEKIYDFDLGQWKLIRQDNESLTDFINKIAESGLFKGEDNAVYDLTLSALLDQNEKIPTFTNTYYFSYVTEQTHKMFFSDHHIPNRTMNPILAIGSAYMGLKTFDQPLYSGFKDSAWCENDGAVSSYSQQYPRISGNHPVAGEFSDATKTFKPGEWYWQYLHDTDHLDVVMLPETRQTEWQEEFYTKLFGTLAGL